MFATTITPQQRLQRCTTRLLATEEFIAVSGVLLIGKRVICPDTATAKTNGRDEFYSADFIGTLTDPELMFVILHEVYHKMYRHMTTWKHLWDIDAERANIAADMVINTSLCGTDAHRDGIIKMPVNGIQPDPQYAGMNTKQIFDKLPQTPQDGQSGFDEHDTTGAEEIDADETAKEIDAALRQGGMLAKKHGGGTNRDLEELLKPTIDWREVLRDFITCVASGRDYSTWGRVNRRYIGAGIIMPGTYSETVGDVVIAVDTSGSIGSRELVSFLSEISGICDTAKPNRVHLVYWDSQVRGHEVYLQDELADLATATKPVGGGGTAVECVPAYLAEKQITAECVIAFTDGYVGSWGSWPCPVLWAIKDNPNCVPNVGKVVYIEGV